MNSVRAKSRCYGYAGVEEFLYRILGKAGLTLASVTLNSLRMYWGMLYSAIGSTTKYWYRADLSAGQYWWHFSCWCQTNKKCRFLVFT